MSDPGVEPLEILEILELETPPYHPHLDFLTTCLFGHPEENCWFRNKLWKWLRWQCCVKRMLNLRPSVWKSARRWLASRCHSPSPSTSGPTSPSPWTPGGWKKKFWQPERRRRPPQRWGATQGGEKSIWGRNSTLQLLRKHSSVTNVTASSNRKTAWRSTSEKPTRMWNQPHHRLIACDSSQAVRQPGLLPPLGCHQGGSRGWEGGASLSPSTTPPSRVGSGGHLSTMRQEALQLYVLCCGGVLRLLLSIRPEVQKIATLVINISVIRS